MGYIPYVKLSRIWKTAVLYLLQNTKCITHEEADRLWKAYPNGFNLNGEVGDTALDRKVSKRLARYLLRPAMAESRIVRYEPGTGVVVFRIRGYKVGFRLKRAVSKGPKGWLPWRSQLWRVYEADPLGCPLCGTEMELLELVVPP